MTNTITFPPVSGGGGGDGSIINKPVITSPVNFIKIL